MEEDQKTSEQKEYATDLETLAKECTWEFFNASGPGGQNVNKRKTAVRLRHPSGIVVEAQEQRTQWQNRIAALERMQARLIELQTPKKTRKRTSVPFAERKRRLGAKRRRKRTLERRSVSREETTTA